MKHLLRFAALGVSLAASATFASATSFSGFIIVQDAPAGDIGSSDSTMFNLSSVFTGVSGTAVNEPNAPGGAPNLVSYFLNPTLFLFTTAGIAGSGSTGIELFSGNNAALATTAFFATSYNSLSQDINGDYALTAYGYFTDGSGNKTPGYDNITFNSGVVNSIANTTNGSVSEILTATPTPEVSSIVLMGTGLLGLAGLLRRKSMA
jgi:hypothetical protein